MSAVGRSANYAGLQTVLGCMKCRRLHCRCLNDSMWSETTAVRNISLVADNHEQIEGRVNGTQIVILTKFVKKAK